MANLIKMFVIVSKNFVTLWYKSFWSLGFSIFFFSFDFLVACYATLQPALSVRPSVRRSVGPSHFTFFGFLRFLASLLLPKWWSDLNYGPCPPARDWGSRVSGLVSYFHSWTSQLLLEYDFCLHAHDWGSRVSGLFEDAWNFSYSSCRHVILCLCPSFCLLVRPLVCP